MATLKIQKSTGIPSTLAPDTLYLCSDPNDYTKLTVVVTNNDGTVLKRTVNQYDLDQLSSTLVKRSDQLVKTADMSQRVGVDTSGTLFVPPSTNRTETAYLPTVGSTTNIRLGSQIIISVARATDGTPETYTIGLTTYSENVTVNYFRSRYRGGGTGVVQGSVTNLALTSSSVTAVNGDTRGDMIDNLDLKIIDANTKEGWSVNFVFFGNGNMNALVTKR